MRSALQNYARTLKFSLYIIVNPFKGFWDMKREKKGSLSAALTILALAVISTVAEAQYLSFPFNTAYYEPKNFFSASLSLLLPFALWCVVSYCLTTLMNGEGAFRDIVMATCYALTPMVLTNPALRAAADSTLTPFWSISACVCDKTSPPKRPSIRK